MSKKDNSNFLKNKLATMNNMNKLIPATSKLKTQNFKGIAALSKVTPSYVQYINQQNNINNRFNKYSEELHRLTYTQSKLIEVATNNISTIPQTTGLNQFNKVINSNKIIPTINSWIGQQNTLTNNNFLTQISVVQEALGKLNISYLEKVFVPYNQNVTWIKDINNILCLPPNPYILQYALLKKKWVIIYNNDIDLELKDKIEHIKNKANRKVKSLENIVIDFYTKNNYQNTFKRLEEVINLVAKSKFYPKSYVDYLRRFQKTLKQDFGNCQLLITNLMTLIENAVAQRLGLLNSSSGHLIKTNLEKTEKKIYENSDLELLMVVLIYLWNGKFQNFPDGIDKVGIGRHSIDHGRVNPDRYTDIVFIKLLLIFDQLLRISWD
ncbi:hypothetical protein [Lactobacillus sp. LL6]|uniref:hypothetical protein n=1 Tax=Lactobacillus sp. LL6 TaxID=2596827 RepID=UPI0011855D4C|nr:hypothetical protein [Lactobacillus sp. LL6]TSO25480.1 hypothetical protein FOD82_09655 [Lactobacillus sp. LL6]